MAPRNKGLGRGLDALLATSKSVSAKEAENSERNDSTNNELKKIPIARLLFGGCETAKLDY